MTVQPEVIQHSELLNQLVLDRNTMEEIGRVEVIWMYVPAHKVLGFVCKTGFLGNQKFAFNLAQIHTFGAKSILVSSAPQETDADRVNQLESIINCEVWSDAGEKLGKITDYRFNLKTGEISEYLLTTGGLSALTDGIYQLPPSKILSIGRRRVLVPAAAVQSLNTYREGIKQKLKKVETVIKDDYTNVTQELRSLSQRMQSVTEQARERARSLAEQAKERSQGLVDQVKEQAQILREQLAEEPFADQPIPPNAPPDSHPAADWDDEWDIETPPATPTEPHLVIPEPAPFGAEPTAKPPAQVPAPTAEPIANASDDDEWDDLWGLDEPDRPATSERSPSGFSHLPTDSVAVRSVEVMPPTTDLDDDDWGDLWDDEPAQPPAQERSSLTPIGALNDAIPVQAETIEESEETEPVEATEEPDLTPALEKPDLDDPLPVDTEEIGEVEVIETIATIELIEEPDLPLSPDILLSAEEVQAQNDRVSQPDRSPALHPEDESWN
jgi:uncharacterized protein YrrD